MMRTSNPCERVNYFHSNGADCTKYENKPLHDVSCRGRERVVPLKLFASSKDDPPYPVRAAAAANPAYELRFHNDTSAERFVRARCGEDAAKAYACLVPPAYRGDLFRFCALSTEGGVYVDADMVLLRPIEEVASLCSDATIGYDWPRRPQEGRKQMKILAGRPNAPLFKCMVNKIVEHARTRFYGSTSLSITGPDLLQRCYEKYPENVSVTYMDARNARWPHAGMRSKNRLFSFEAPNEERHLGITRQEKGDRKKDVDYAKLYEKRMVYSKTCEYPAPPTPPPPPSPPPSIRHPVSFEYHEVMKRLNGVRAERHNLLSSDAWRKSHPPFIWGR